MSFEDNIDRISIYSVKSTNFTKSTYKSIKKGTRLFSRFVSEIDCKSNKKKKSTI